MDMLKSKLMLTWGLAGAAIAACCAVAATHEGRGRATVDLPLPVSAAQMPAPAAAAPGTAGVAEKGVSDSWITLQVRSAYADSGEVNGASIRISTKDGVVTLVGSAASGTERIMAIRLAKGVYGVKSVDHRRLRI